MNSRRASSSCASRTRMRSNASRQLAELVRAVVTTGSSNRPLGDLVGRPLEPPDPAREHPGAAVPEQERDQQRRAGREQQPLPDERERPELVLHRVARRARRPVQDRDARPRRSGCRPRTTVPRGSTVRSSSPRAATGSSSTSLETDLLTESWTTICGSESRCIEDDHARRSVGRGRPDERRGRRHSLGGKIRARSSPRHVQLRDSRVHEPALERRHDGHVDDPERNRDHDRSSARLSWAPTLRSGFIIAEAVADAAHGEDELGLARIALELLAQVAHVDVDRPRLAVVGAAPERLQQHLAACRRGPGWAASVAQELELHVGELDRLAVALHGPPGEIDAQSVGLDRLVPAVGRAGEPRARRRSARTRLRNSRIENGFVM